MKRKLTNRDLHLLQNLKISRLNITMRFTALILLVIFCAHVIMFCLLNIMPIDELLLSENQIIFNNIYDELAFSLSGCDKFEIEERVSTALKQVGMFDYKNCDLYSLSLGQKQRIIIAEVLAQHPKYIIFDEPTTMLDGIGKELVYDIIRELKELRLYYYMYY